MIPHVEIEPDDDGDAIVRLAREGCPCVVNHNPNPTELHKHHVWPLGEGGPKTEANGNILKLLCPTTHANVHRLWRIYEWYDGEPPWEVLQHFSKFVRELVEEGRRLRDQGQ